MEKHRIVLKDFLIWLEERGILVIEADLDYDGCVESYYKHLRAKEAAQNDNSIKR